MGSRADILAKIKTNKPDALKLPVIDSSIFDDGKNLLEEFTKKVEVVGGNVYKATSNEDVISQVSKLIPDSKINYSTLDETDAFNTVSLDEIKRPHELEDLDILVLQSKLGIAENGAIWLSDDQIPMRVLPFITKHLVLVLEEKNIVPFLHQGYEILKNLETDYGLFISGPSKTADIEQSLVIGAHGALSLSVFLL